MKNTLKINGLDMTSKLSGHGYTIEYIKTQGSNGGVMLDGSEVEDTLKVKAKINVSLIPLTQMEMSIFLNVLHDDQYAQVYLYDPMLGDYKTSECIYEEPAFKPLLEGVDGNDYWRCDGLTFKERG